MGKISQSATQLYRHYDSSGNLLYVGVSLNVAARLMQHRRNAEWFGEIANITVEHFDNRTDALRAEYEAIILEDPKHNLKRPERGGDLIFETGNVLRMMPPMDGDFNRLVAAATRLFPEWIEDSDDEFPSEDAYLAR